VSIPIEYPLNALLVRKSIIAFSDPGEADAFLATTNFPFVKTTNNTLIFGGAEVLVPGFITNSNFKVAVYTTNTVANNLYLNEFAIALQGPWFHYTDTWTNQVNTEHLDFAYVSNPDNTGFFRTRDVTLQWDTNAVNQANGTGTCGGSYTASANFYWPGHGSNYVWGYPIDFNTKVHKITAVGDTNAWIQVEGRYGQQFCGKGEVTLTGNNPATGSLDPFFRFSVLYDTSPGSNSAVMFTGFDQFLYIY
jgi:hypothetical protein